MTRREGSRVRILVLTAAMAIVFGRDVAVACEIVRGPWQDSGPAQFVAQAGTASSKAVEVFAHLVVGRNGAETIPAGDVVLVPWSFGTDCKPLVWHQTRDGVWSPPTAPAFYTGRLRNRDAWVLGMPTIDIAMARLQPVWEAGRQGFGTSAGPLLTPVEFFDFYQILPTRQEFDAKEPQALARVEAWQSAHPDLTAREPARSMLGSLRTLLGTAVRR